MAALCSHIGYVSAPGTTHDRRRNAAGCETRDPQHGRALQPVCGTRVRKMSTSPGDCPSRRLEPLTLGRCDRNSWRAHAVGVESRFRCRRSRAVIVRLGLSK